MDYKYLISTAKTKNSRLHIFDSSFGQVSNSYIIILYLTIFLLSGCNENRSIISPKSTDVITPLNAGNTWVYLNYVDSVPDTSKLEILGDSSVTYNNYSYQIYFLNWNIDLTSGPLDENWLFWNGKSGLYLMGGVSTKDSYLTKILYRKYPINVGDSWTVPRLIYKPDIGEYYVERKETYKCVSTNTIVETPAGKFECYEYYVRRKPEEDVLGEWDYHSYYAPDIGLVGQLIKSSRTGSVKFKSLLYSYNLK